MKSADYIVAYVVQYMSKGVVYTVMYLLYHFWMPREVINRNGQFSSVSVSSFIHMNDAGS